MPGLVLDTHSLIWYLDRSPKLSSRSLERIEAAIQSGAHLFVPSICIVEIVYLRDKRRVSEEYWSRLESQVRASDSPIVLLPLDWETAAAVHRIPREHVPDMPDRIIAATAFHLELPLVTKDTRIASVGIETIW